MKQDARRVNRIAAIGLDEFVPKLVATVVNAQGVVEVIAQLKGARGIGRFGKIPGDGAFAAARFDLEGSVSFAVGAHIVVAVLAHAVKGEGRNFVERDAAKG